MTLDENDKATTTLSRGAKTSLADDAEECCKCPPMTTKNSTENDENSTESEDETTTFENDSTDNSTMKDRGGRTSFGEDGDVDNPNSVEKDVDMTTDLAETDDIDTDSRKLKKKILLKLFILK